VVWLELLRVCWALQVEDVECLADPRLWDVSGARTVLARFVATIAYNDRGGLRERWVKVKSACARARRSEAYTDILAATFVMCIDAGDSSSDGSEWLSALRDICQIRDRRVRLQLAREALRWRRLPCDAATLNRAVDGVVPSWARALQVALGDVSSASWADGMVDGEIASDLMKCLQRGNQLLLLTFKGGQ
jgi:hypothetical protein